MDLDVAELLASLATLAGEDRAVSAAAEVLGAQGVAPAVPLLQPLALSAATRRAVAGHDGLLRADPVRGRRRQRAGRPGPGPGAAREAPDPAGHRRRGRRVLLSCFPSWPRSASSWRALQSAHWIWLPVVIAFSVLTYLASAISLLGSVTVRLPFWPTVLTQGASSFVNRVSPANVGGMALNVRYLQKSGVEPSAGVAAVGVNALAGAAGPRRPAGDLLQPGRAAA